MNTETKTKIANLKEALELIARADEILHQDENYISYLESKEGNQSLQDTKNKLSTCYTNLDWTIENLENN